MVSDSKNESWVPPCDLCGSFRHELLKLPAALSVRRCRDCGLVSITHPDDARPQSFRTGVPEEILVNTLKGLQGDRPLSVLMIGVPSEAIMEASRETGADLTVLVEPGSGPYADVSTRQGSFDSASFVPEKFDLILCARGLESFPSPSRLFDRARYWLAPGGTLLIGALNMDSLPARLRRQSWLMRYTANAEHLFTLDTLKGYAERFGFDIRSVRSRSRTEEVASIITGKDRAMWLTEMALAPLTLTASLLGLGVTVVVEMRKAGLVMRPMLRDVEEEMEGSPGLAPALYTGVNRERTVVSG